MRIEEKVYRWVLLSVGLLYIAWFFMLYFDYYFLELGTEEKRMIAFNGYNTLLPDIPILYRTLMLLFLLSIFGLYFFKNWARNLFIGILAFNVMATPFAGLSVTTAYDSFLLTLLDISYGVILALVFLKPISEKFSADLKE
jgi:hypothetical protein